MAISLARRHMALLLAGGLAGVAVCQAAPVREGAGPVGTRSAAGQDAPAPVDSIAVQLDRYRANPVAAPPPRLDARSLPTFFRQLKSSAADWIQANGPADEPQRRLAVATYVLDLINAQNAGVLQSFVLLFRPIDWAGDVLRGGPPLPAERDWYIAAAPLIEMFDSRTRADGTGVQATGWSPLVGLYDHANDRLPGDPRWQRGYAIAADLLTFPDSHNGHLAFKVRDDGPFIEDTEVTALTNKFAKAAAIPAVSQDVELRWGYFELRIGRPADALTHFHAVGDPSDVFMRYWLHLFEGRAFEDTHAPDDAVAAYRAALAVVPNAQSATVALAAALVAEHHTADAVPLVNAMLETPAPLDPWPFYVCPDRGAWPQAITNLRKALAP